MMINTTPFATCLIFCLLSLMVLDVCHGLPLKDMLRSKLLFDSNNNNGGSIDSFHVPDFARPDDTGDLQRNSARLHRTLFLLDTSDLLKKARLLGVTASNSDNTNNKLTSERFSRIFRFRREAKPPSAEPAKYINVIKVRKPFLSIDERPSWPGMSEATR